MYICFHDSRFERSRNELEYVFILLDEQLVFVSENVKNVINALAAQTDDIELVIDALNVTTNDLRGDTEQDI